MTHVLITTVILMQPVAASQMVAPLFVCVTWDSMAMVLIAEVSQLQILIIIMCGIISCHVKGIFSDVKAK